MTYFWKEGDCKGELREVSGVEEVREISMASAERFKDRVKNYTVTNQKIDKINQHLDEALGIAYNIYREVCNEKR